MRLRLLATIISLLLGTTVAFAQTSAFTYQGKLSDSGAAANGNYDIQFKLFDTATVGTGAQQGPTITSATVTVTNGVFTVQLDFGAGVFTGLPRFLELGVRPAGNTNPYNVLTPRQPVTSTPYAVRSLNSSVADVLSSSCVGCVTSTQVGSVSGSAVTGKIPVASVPAGSSNYVQNATSQQSASNFNISGNGTAGGTLAANAVTATTQFNIGAFRVLSRQGNENLFVGAGTGQSNTTGGGNSFAGANAGFSNTTGQSNSFFGNAAGADNLAGSDNSFFGYAAGNQNTTGSKNAFFGREAGLSNTDASENTFVGYRAGFGNTANQNAFLGSQAGAANTNGTGNTFTGYHAGFKNTAANRNSFFGAEAGATNVDTADNTFVGYRAGFANTANHNAFLGSQAGAANTSGSGNSFFGHNAGSHNTVGYLNTFTGDDSGISNTEGAANNFYGGNAGFLNTTGGSNSFFGDNAGNTNTTGSHNTIVGSIADVGSANLSYATAIGAGAVVSTSNTIALGRPDGSDLVEFYGRFQMDTLGPANNPLCYNSANRIGSCSSSLRYKTEVQSFLGGLDIVRRLRPISFTWKEDGQRDLGLGAEEVAKVEPRLTFRNKQGEIEGVRYNQVSAVLINAVNEQQAQIAEQRRTIEQQQQLLKQQQASLQALQRIVYRTYGKARVCK